MGGSVDLNPCTYKDAGGPVAVQAGSR